MNGPKVFKLGIGNDLGIEVTWFGVERSKVKVTRSTTLHNGTSFQTTTALRSHSLGGDTDNSNTV